MILGFLQREYSQSLPGTRCSSARMRAVSALLRGRCCGSSRRCLGRERSGRSPGLLWSANAMRALEEWRGFAEDLGGVEIPLLRFARCE